MGHQNGGVDEEQVLGLGSERQYDQSHKRFYIPRVPLLKIIPVLSMIPRE